MSIEVLILVETKGFAEISNVNTVRDFSNLMKHSPFITVAHFSIILRGKKVRELLLLLSKKQQPFCVLTTPRHRDVPLARPSLQTMQQC